VDKTSKKCKDWTKIRVNSSHNSDVKLTAKVPSKSQGLDYKEKSAALIPISSSVDSVQTSHKGLDFTDKKKIKTGK
jgi:hypothetical protein